MRWFKHYCDATRGQSIQILMDKFGHTGLCYWILVEMCAEKLEKKEHERVTEADCEFSFHFRILRQNLRIGAVKLQAFLSQCQTMALLSYEIKDNLVLISMPKLAEILDSDQKRPVHKRATNTPRIDKEEDKDKEYIKTEFLEKNPDLNFFFNIKKIRQSLYDAWVSSYPDDFIKNELAKAHIWVLANEKKAPKDVGRFLSNWLSKGWESYRKTIPTNKGWQQNHPMAEKPDYWLTEADNFFKALKDYGSLESTRLKEFLGETRFEWWLKIGRSRVASFKTDEWGRRDLAKLIKAVATQTYDEAVA